MIKENSFNLIILFFYDKQTEREFIKDYAARSVRIIRLGFLLASILFIVVGLLLDKRSFPDNPFILAGWRITGSLINMAITYNKSGLFNYSLAIAAYIIFVYTLSRLRFIYALVLIWSAIIIYTIWLDSISPPEGILSQNVVSLVVINLFGMIACYGSERNIRDAFINSKQLQISRQMLAEEHKRTSYELTSVKELQLSMLPEKLLLSKQLMLHSI